MLSAEDLRDVDEQLLDYLRDGRITPAYARVRLKEDVDEYSRGYVQQRLSRLEEHQHAVNLFDVGLYELLDDPREDAGAEDTIAVDAERFQRLLDAHAQDDPQIVNDTLEAFREDHGDTDE